MYKDKRILAIIPARGGSKGVPRKNIKLLAGKPLIYYTIEFAKKSKYVNRIIVSTDDENIKKVALKYGVEVIDRPKELASDTALTKEVVKHVIKQKPDFDVVVLLQPTSPLRKTETIDLAIKQFIDNYEDYDSLMPIRRFQLKTGKVFGGYYVPEKGERRSQDLEEKYYECGTIFVYKTYLIKKDNIYGKRIFPFIVKDGIEAIDIDTLEDFKIAETLIQNKASVNPMKMQTNETITIEGRKIRGNKHKSFKKVISSHSK